ncbi:50S ribosomal protein L14 [Anaplasmataceae bacterium AB001_6]|nr:50S ribosomal protein L14 [Anaplasmataceae bacterium AB001_6]
MIIAGTVLKVADNSGAKEVICIGLLKNYRVASIGDTIVISVRKIAPGSTKISKGNVYRAVVVRVKKKIFMDDGTELSFNDNAIVILGDNGDIIGSRVFGPIPRSLKRHGFSKIVSLAFEVL